MQITLTLDLQLFWDISEAHLSYLRHTWLLSLPNLILLLLVNILSYNPRIEHSTFVASEQRSPQYFDSKKQSIFVDLIVLLYEFKIVCIFGGRFPFQSSEGTHDGVSSIHTRLYQIYNAKSNRLCQHPLKRKVIGIFNTQHKWRTLNTRAIFKEHPPYQMVNTVDCCERKDLL